MALSALRFLTLRLLDREAGGIYGATEVRGHEPLSTDKQLPDQASAVLALAEHGADEDLRTALEGLRNMQDRHGNPGFVELTDRHWRAYPAGRVRTLRFQVHAAAALLAGAYRLDDDELRARAVDLLNRCLSTARDGRLPTRLAEDWQTVLDEPETPQSTVAVVRALATAEAVGETGVDASSLPELAEHLRWIAEQANWPRPAAEFARCGSVARLVLALGHAGRLLDTEQYLKVAELTLAAAINLFHDPDDGGFWDLLAPNGSVRVDWIGAPNAGRAPFPVKRAADAAQLVLAGRLLETSGFDGRDAAELGQAALADLTDYVHGGVYLGLGYQWATPTDPVVPLVQQLWARPKWPGMLGDGSPAHLALHQKSAHTHATVIRALGTAEPAAPALPVASMIRRGSAVVPVAADRLPARPTARVDANVPLPVDRDRHLRALVGPGRRDRAYDDVAADHMAVALRGGWRASSVYHAVADVGLLGGTPDLLAPLVAQVRGSQNPDGGFGERPGQISDVSSTCYSLLALHLAGQAPQRPDAARDYILSSAFGDGGFGAVPGLVSDVWHTNLAVVALHLLGAVGWSVADCAEFVLSARTADGGYANRTGRPASTSVVRRAVSTLLLLGVPVPDAEATVCWLHGCQVGSGGFTHRPGRGASALGTHHAVGALALLGAAPLDPEACERWLTAQRSPDGLFEFHDGLPPDPDDGFTCLQSLAVLRGAVNREWIALVA